MSIFSDPVKWAESAAKSKARLIIFIVSHIGLLMAALWTSYDSIVAKNRISDLSYTEFLVSSSQIVFIGAIFPSLYLYSMYRMIKIIKEKDNVNTAITLNGN
ncbi:hypothetical protein [Alteromonas macleodii]|jgi:hypothetical protein|uniref:hypothetical protein n=1 Tax=Alteromonas macleodii TaxID=28108 RepID=UPI00313B63A7|tara:strand:+ start:2497 stop:2802 length:306 start_codon:yes stop_codon:yes gene_type:complete